MAKDYFQDITPPEAEDAGQSSSNASTRKITVAPASDQQAVGQVPPPDRGIRNVNIVPRPRPSMSDVRTGAPPLPPPLRRPSGNRLWLWILTGISIFVVLALLILFVFRSTSVSVVPQTQQVTFDGSAQFTAYPEVSAASGTIPYATQSTDLEDSEAVQSTGTEHAETKASGEITVVNNYSASALRFVKGTRFQSGSGLIFKAPDAVVVPGKSTSAPGKVTVTVVAESSGASHNIGPQQRFSIPGLKSSGAEYTSVYAYSTASTTGGFSGDQPAVSQSDLDTARATVRARLQEKAKAFADTQNIPGAILLASTVSFTDEPNTPEAGNMVRIHESAHVIAAAVPSDIFASAVAQMVAADASPGSVKLIPGKGFAAALKDSGASIGTDPLPFTLGGQATLVWNVDTGALAKALAGRDSAAFQTIVSNFPGVQSAHARIEPFWENRFPSNPADIHITVAKPNAPQS